MFQLSNFGKKFGLMTGIGELMNDIAEATLSTKDAILMGGGNPAHIAEIEALFRIKMESFLQDKDRFEKLIGAYDSPQGKDYFLKDVAAYFRSVYGWKITEKNIAVTNGSQNAFFYLLNLFSGPYENGTRKKIILPMVPEYIGYADQTIDDDAFRSFLPKIEYTAPHRFKYKVDFNALQIDHNAGAICVTRPTNPTGNVLTDEEMRQLLFLSKQHHLPLLVDSAYGDPFPGILFQNTEPLFDENIIYSYSLSKLGLPALRTGIVVANEEIIQSLSNINAIVNLSSGSFGQAIADPLFVTKEISKMSQEIIKPYYQEKSRFTLSLIDHYFPKEIEYFIHESEGAFFLWLWLKKLPVSSQEFYLRLKNKGVYLIPGHYFFPGINVVPYKNECVRITFSQEEKILERGIKIISEELQNLYSEKR